MLLVLGIWVIIVLIFTTTSVVIVVLAAYSNLIPLTVLLCKQQCVYTVLYVGNTLLEKYDLSGLNPVMCIVKFQPITPLAVLDILEVDAMVIIIILNTKNITCEVLYINTYVIPIVLLL